jgi:hypothetical protein
LICAPRWSLRRTKSAASTRVKAGQRDEVVDRGENLVLVEHADSDAHLFFDLIAVPDRQRVVRRERRALAGLRGRRAATPFVAQAVSAVNPSKSAAIDALVLER